MTSCNQHQAAVGTTNQDTFSAFWMIILLLMNVIYSSQSENAQANIVASSKKHD
jgi:hypothetical protein